MILLFSPTTHSPQGFAIGVLLLMLLQPLGLDWTAWVLAVPLSWTVHWLLDMIIHFEFIHIGSLKDFNDAMAVDLKNLWREATAELGWVKALGRGSRERLAAMPGYEKLANPPAIKIFSQAARRAGVLDVLLSGILALVLAWLCRANPAMAAIGVWSAMWAVMPDLVLLEQIHQWALKHPVRWFSNFYWWIDAVHNRLHTRVLPYEKRWLGLVIEIAMMVVMCGLAWWAISHAIQIAR